MVDICKKLRDLLENGHGFPDTVHTKMQTSSTSEIQKLDITRQDFRIPQGCNRRDPTVVQYVLYQERGAEFHVRTEQRPPHWALALVLRGQGSLRLESSSYALSGGMAYALVPGMRFEVSCDPRHPLQLYQIGFKGEEFRELFEQQLQAPTLIRIQDLTPIRSFIETMHQEARFKRPKQQELLCACGKALLLLCANQGRENRDGEAASRKQFLRCCEYMQQHVKQITRVQQVCEHMKLSRAYLDRIFKEHAQTRPRDYLQQLRIEKVCEQLLDPGHTLEAIAEDMNFSSGFALSRSFKRELGLSPREWRNNGM